MKFNSTAAGSINPANKNLTWGDLALINAEKIMGIGARFAAAGNQTIDNLEHIKDGQIVGQWRDSTYGDTSLTSPSSLELTFSRHWRRKNPVRRQHGPDTRCSTWHCLIIPSRVLQRTERLEHDSRHVRPSLGRRDTAVLRSPNTP